MSFFFVVVVVFVVANQNEAEMKKVLCDVGMNVKKNIYLTLKLLTTSLYDGGKRIESVRVVECKLNISCVH